MAINTIVTIALALATVLALAGGLYLYARTKTLNEIRGDVYNLFLKAEHTFLVSGSGKQKMKWVVSQARGLLTGWAQMFITDELLYKVIEGWFQAVKDLLDDGKLNQSAEEPDENQ